MPKTEDIFRTDATKRFPPPVNDELTEVNDLGLLYHEEKRFDKSLEQFWTGLKRSRELGYREWESIALNNIGMVYQSWGKCDQALKFYHQSLQVAKEIGFLKGESAAYQHLGRIYDLWGQVNKSLQYYELSLKISDKTNDLPNKRTSMLNMAHCYEKLGNYGQCEKILNEVIKIDEVISHPDLATDHAYLERLKVKGL
ncbi:MAG: hypothetical protein AUK24_02400 [Syntrophaceae bacterium CG2_30_49_12]|nr:MAG: hypothetical protein AUK24_02400 [Syntrophaceae bacterium CG2_30_49_12]PIP05270.1 MAG: hypothetical protein COX52_12950 [Syntrophobacterales bacterium CG23_combo_of_CG06-09_8_20_14_all_48_27]PJC72968.1 MAG: hypothetical protein CO012_10665 [Syntrophobacterales bacterium CG_4_8_14_3_um_filter_49_14]